METSEKSEPEVVCWRDGALDGACLASARYGNHKFDRHLHDELVIVMTEAGAGQCHTRAGSEIAGPGSVLVFGPGEYHSGEVWEGREWIYRAIYLDMEGLGALSAVFSSNSRADKPLLIPPGLYQDPHLASLLVKAHASLDERGSVSLMERQANWWAAMGMLVGRYGRSGEELVEPRREARKMEQVREYVAANYERDISVDELAELVGLSRYYLTRAFCKAFGLPPHAYATQVRLLAAKRMLAAGHNAATAAAAVGFYDQSHLNRLFKRAYGITPGTYAALKPGH
ncbi:AraC family transcriptional regulator [Paraburkholderia xenovorans]|uniref:AraC family transcriptional regulator n=1 Tax=Paraburkholderia xenovorans TaxID=36873 RepID=UPI0015598552|nr:AraC family transcriptional regulator [Paraburkholderia xenovorans]NPT38285.1 helix-turn-helix domain-containing protein [Paraburkholderia xenovorans]